MIYLSLGAGVQSSALYVMTTLGLHGCPKADVAIFADTQDEPAYVYDQLSSLSASGSKHGGPKVESVTAGHLSADVIGRHNGTRPPFAAVPAFTLGDDGRPAILRRQCTREYKIAPIEKRVRTLLGLVPRQRAKGSAVLSRAPLLVLAGVPLPDGPARQRSGGRCLTSGRVRNTSAPGWVAGANLARGFRCRRG